METEAKIILYMTILLFFLIFLIIYLIKSNFSLRQKLKDIGSSKKSTEVRHGKAWEEFVPFLKDFPYTKERFKFIGDPIDGISFEDEKIAIIEIKTGSSKLSEKQKRIKQLVESGKVEFKELRY
ncbi:MAG: Holliday junction resolvase-like protein [Candidatus Woesearchaeota archaeon]